MSIAALMAFDHMVAAALREEAEVIPGVEEGMPWLRWHGSMASVLRELGLISKDHGVTSRDDANVRRGVNMYLKGTCNAVCVYRGNNRLTKPVWAVRSKFREEKADRGAINWTALSCLPGEGAPRHVAEPAAARGMSLQPDAAGDEEVARKRLSPCPHCSVLYADVYLFRHVSAVHGLDPAEILITAIQQRRGTKVRSPELAALLSEACGGGVVQASYVGRVLRPFADDPSSPVVSHRLFQDFWYTWDESVASATPAEPGVDPVAQPVLLGEVVPPPAEPAPHVSSAVLLERAAARARERARLIGIMPPASTAELAVPATALSEPAVPSSNGSHAPATSDFTARSRLDAISAAFRRAEDAAQEMYTALDEAKAAAEEIEAENSELRGYRDRVKRLLSAAGE